MFGNETCKEIVENICPYCKQTLLMNKRSFANHIRWCKCNPRYNELRFNTIEKIKNTVKQKRKMHSVKCSICGNIYTICCTDNIFNSGKYRKTCSDTCAHKLTHKNSDNELRYKKVSETMTHKAIIKICPYCGVEFETHRNNKYCSKQCANKGRQLNTDFKRHYKNCCNFSFSLNDYIDEFDFSLIQKFGWYKATNNGNNLNGVSRDHMVSKDFGYDHLIDPYIISHPANCKLLQHTENISKYSKCSITVDELLKRIETWHAKYGIYENKIDYSYFEKHGIKLKKFNIG